MKHKILLLLGLMILSVNFASSFVLNGGYNRTDNYSWYNIDDSYSPNSILRGNVNLSIADEPINSLVTGFMSNTTISNFLSLNDVSFNCNPIDCQSSYSSNSGESGRKDLSILERMSGIIGVRLSGERVDGINKFEFNVSSDANPSCIYPLQLDILADNVIEFQSNNITNTSFCDIEKEFG